MLTLPITGRWFQMILSGKKKEEYRNLTHYYKVRFRSVFEMYPYSFIPVGNDKHKIKFRNGYRKDSPEFIAVCSLDMKTGREEWGAVPGEEYYVLTIHEIIERNRC